MFSSTNLVSKSLTKKKKIPTLQNVNVGFHDVSKIDLEQNWINSLDRSCVLITVSI